MCRFHVEKEAGFGRHFSLAFLAIALALEGMKVSFVSLFFFARSKLQFAKKALEIGSSTSSSIVVVVELVVCL